MKKTSLVTFVISILALIVSILSFGSQNHYAGLEHEYKSEPEIEIEGGKKEELGKYITLNDSENKIQLLQKNNLQSAYIIHSDCKMEKLVLNEEGILETTGEIDFNESNVSVNDTSYHYELLLLEEMDDSYELYLLCRVERGVEGKFELYRLSGIETSEQEEKGIKWQDTYSVVFH